MGENPQLEDGHTRIANELLEALSRQRLTVSEWRVLMVVLRKTYGWSKKDDWIPLSQIKEVCGMDKPHISRSLRLLAMRNIVTPRGNKIGINKFWSQWKKLPHGVTNHSVTPQGNGVTPRGNKSLPHGAPQKKRKQLLQKQPSSTKKGRNASVDVLLNVMRECFGNLDDSEKQNRRYAWLLIQKAMKAKPESTEQEAAAACVALMRAAKGHDWWGSRLTRVQDVYRNASKIANALRESSSNVAFIS
jgi:phage replication O-like protein O